MSNLPTRTTMRRRSLVAGLGLAALLATGCTAGDWREASPPAAGVQLNVGDMKLRNLVVVTDDKGSAVLFGAGLSPVDDALTGMAIVPFDANSKPGEPQITKAQVTFAKNVLTPTDIAFSDPALKAGLTASVTLQFDKAGTGTVVVPTLASTHPDFKDAWAKLRK